MQRLAEVGNKLKSNEQIKAILSHTKYLCLPKGLCGLLEESLKRKEEERWKKELVNGNGKEPLKELLGLQNVVDTQSDSIRLLKNSSFAHIAPRKSNTKNTNYRLNKNLKKA
jgi:hypothetical protein